ncbi:MAG: IMP dehydrogenase, partial [Thermoanaerobaculia bacterium]
MAKNPRTRSDDAIPLALTFDDVLLLPAHSEVHPREVDLSTRLT